jgi:hypothetical protein
MTSLKCQEKIKIDSLYDIYHLDRYHTMTHKISVSTSLGDALIDVIGGKEPVGLPQDIKSFMKNIKEVRKKLNDIEVLYLAPIAMYLQQNQIPKNVIPQMEYLNQQLEQIVPHLQSFQ